MMCSAGALDPVATLDLVQFLAFDDLSCLFFIGKKKSFGFE